MQTATLTEDNKKTQPLAFAISIAIYGVFLAVLFFLKLMYTPPEEPEGVELNYGIDLVGSGDIQTTNKANPSPNNYDVKPAAKEEEAKPLKVKPVVTPPPVAEKPVKVKVKEAPAKPVITSKVESPVVEKEVEKPSKKIETKPDVKPSPVETKTKAETPRPETPKHEPPKRTVDDGSLFKKGTKGSNGANGSNSNSNGTIGTRDGIGGNNNGDGKKGEVGDKGDPRGTLDGKSLYGNPGKGGGSGASIGGLSGWNKKKLSLPNDGSSETGKIVFKVTVDDSGDVVGISVIESTVSPAVQNFYKNYIQQKLSSVLTPAGTPPPRASGTITINIQSGN
ncbi:cell envelope integrity protein TolA [Emticicia soli]|uniref:Cell envelope integrity protein TolA n=1 Tax=Emticicia soli TaxID=2027878 RepID=A0ABW5J6B4_9BACT